ncbi:MAG: thiamine diphosphokinase [Treponema sp.]|nr:thiamine diphosphokinase [Treponema sp.]
MQNPKKIHIVVFTGGLSPDYEKSLLYWKTHPQVDYVIAADSGLETCILYGFNPCVILGDFDSISDKAVLDAFNDDIKVSYPMDKDYTDTELAIEKAYEISSAMGAVPFITLVGGDGGRVDHFLSIYDSFSSEHHPDVWLCREQVLYFLGDGMEAEVNGLKKDDVVSVSRTTAEYSGGKIFSEGLEWEADLFRMEGMPSLSNRISSEYAKNRMPVRISVQDGDFMLILPHNAVVTQVVRVPQI